MWFGYKILSNGPLIDQIIPLYPYYGWYHWDRFAFPLVTLKDIWKNAHGFPIFIIWRDIWKNVHSFPICRLWLQSLQPVLPKQNSYIWCRYSVTGCIYLILNILNWTSGYVEKSAKCSSLLGFKSGQYCAVRLLILEYIKEMFSLLHSITAIIFCLEKAYTLYRFNSTAFLSFISVWKGSEYTRWLTDPLVHVLGET
jgi:hypothetical protein